MNRGYLERLENERVRLGEWRLLDEALRLRPGRPGWLRRRLGRALMTFGANLAGVCVDAAAS